MLNQYTKFMCLDLRTDQKRNDCNAPIPLIAKKDIICYKYLVILDKGKYKTPYRDFVVKHKATMEATLRCSQYSVYEGIHAFTSLKKAKVKIIGNKGAVVVEAIIPKGAQYFRGKDSDIVATKMKIGRRLLHQTNWYTTTDLTSKRKKK
jgi:hypothetical protein